MFLNKASLNIGKNSQSTIQALHKETCWRTISQARTNTQSSSLSMDMETNNRTCRLPLVPPMIQLSWLRSSFLMKILHLVRQQIQIVVSSSKGYLLSKNRWMGLTAPLTNPWTTTALTSHTHLVPVLKNTFILQISILLVPPAIPNWGNFVYFIWLIYDLDWWRYTRGPFHFFFYFSFNRWLLLLTQGPSAFRWETRQQIESPSEKIDNNDYKVLCEVSFRTWCWFTFSPWKRT